MRRKKKKCSHDIKKSTIVAERNEKLHNQIAHLYVCWSNSHRQMDFPLNFGSGAYAFLLLLLFWTDTTWSMNDLYFDEYVITEIRKTKSFDFV